MSLKVVSIFDKFRGTLSQARIADIVKEVSRERNWRLEIVKASDGGEGFLECFPGKIRHSVVSGPFGCPRRVRWRSDGISAAVEVAEIVGHRNLVSGARPLDATSFGVGELLVEILGSNPQSVAIGCGGSITTDGGFGLVAAVTGTKFERLPQLSAYVDTATCFVDAARVFGRQKGATPKQIEWLARRLSFVADLYQWRFGHRIHEVEGSGAAGGISGAVFVLGGKIVSGAQAILHRDSVHASVSKCDVLVTGEGYFDHQSLKGKVVSAVLELGKDFGKPVYVVVGDYDERAVEETLAAYPTVRFASLVKRVGFETATKSPESSLAAALLELPS